MNYNETLTKPYQREAWQRLLGDIFQSNARLDISPSPVEVNKDLAKHAFCLGHVKLADENTLGVYEVELAPNVNISRNRRGIRDLLTNEWRYAGHVGAFVLSHKEGDSVYRFSYVSSIYGFNEAGEYLRQETDTRRFTYLLGASLPCRTAAQRFETLSKSPKRLEDVTEAFNVEALSDEFFNRYKEHYLSFVAYIADPSNGIRQHFLDTSFDHTGMTPDKVHDREEKPIRDYVKKLLGRIVFLHFLQKKGWLGVPAGKPWGEGDPNFLMNLYLQATPPQKENFLDRVLEPLFSDALDKNRSRVADVFNTKVPGFENVRIPYLNGGLFERDEQDKLDCPLPARLFDELLTMLSQYNFTIDENDPNDAEVGVDPEMLGRIFENLLEDNKEKGAFYTPKEIVQYMCRESLIAYLQTGRTEEERQSIRLFVSGHDPKLLASPGLRESVLEELSDVRICDPAIGSGAFPMGLLRELFYCLCALSPGLAEDPALVKRHIIEHNIYGVDLDRGAVDIARLRFWLALIVDEREPITLPNLDFKIMQGNSLLEQYEGYDLSHIMDETEEVFDFDTCNRALVQEHIPRYYATDDHHERLRLRNSISEAVKKLIIANVAGTIEDKLNPIDIHETDLFFLWHTWFSDVFSRPGKPGFDIVIGNPPYVQLQNNHGVLADTYEDAGFKTFERTGDIYCLFYERGLQLLCPGGHLCFITSNKWMRAAYGEKTRSLLAEGSDPLLLIDFAGVKIFESATVDTNILLLRKAESRHSTLCAVTSRKEPEAVRNLASFVREHSSICSFHGGDSWVILSPIEQSIKSKIEAAGTPLGDWDIQINYGIKTGCNEAFIVTTHKRDELLALCRTPEERQRTERLLRPILRGRDIKRYGYTWADLWLIYLPWHFPYQLDSSITGASAKAEAAFREQYPAVYSHMLAYKEKLSKRNQSETGIRYEWYAMQRWGANYWEDFNKPKITWKRVGSILRFCYDAQGNYPLDSTCFATGENIEFLCCVLNSPMGHYMLSGAPTTGTGDLLISVQAVEPLRVPKISGELNAFFKECIERMLDGTLRTEDDINEKIFDLYGLDEEERKYIRSREH